MKRTQLRRMLAIIGRLTVILMLISPALALDLAAQSQKDSLPVTLALSDGQFVYGPNVQEFNLDDYLHKNAPHLLPYRDAIFYYSAFPSINPRVLLTLLELRGQIVTKDPGDAKLLTELLNIPGSDIESQLEYLSRNLSQAYYDYLSQNVQRPTPTQHLPWVLSAEGKALMLEGQLNAATFAVVSALGPHMDTIELRKLLSTDSKGFYKTYVRLFPDSDPLDQSNRIDIAAAPPSSMLQFPFPLGESWSFNGVHNWS
ncbi:MAG: hypothetical protein FJ026_11355, partial [Chloroflexi bacterium]|nr:hypothetical protein [Chloroflexota bacterium]